MLRAAVNVIKLFLEGNLDYPKIKNLKKVCSKPKQKYEENAILKTNYYALKLFIPFMHFPILHILGGFGWHLIYGRM